MIDGYIDPVVEEKERELERVMTEEIDENDVEARLERLKKNSNRKQEREHFFDIDNDDMCR